jgi:hypothetical protein
MDDAPPSTVVDLAARFVPPDSVRLSWSAPGNDGSVGRASSYELHVTGQRDQARSFSGGGVRADLPGPDSSGTPQAFTVRIDAKNSLLFFALRARDAVGNISAASNVAAALTPLGAPQLVTTLAAPAVAESSVTLEWSAPAAGPPAMYQIRATRASLEENSASGTSVLLLHAPGTLGRETAVVPGLARDLRWAFVVASLDAAGATLGLSNRVEATPRRPEGVWLAARAQPARAPVEFDWRGMPGMPSRLELYDVGGRRVRTIRCPVGVDQGRLVWNGRDDSGARIRAGLYFARLTSGARRAIARVVLLP